MAELMIQALKQICIKKMSWKMPLGCERRFSLQKIIIVFSISIHFKEQAVNIV
jgi:hypothetical protein